VQRRGLASGVVPHGVDLVARDVQAVTTAVLQQQVVAFGAADGALDHAAVARHPVLVVHHEVARFEVVEKPLAAARPGPGPPVGAPPAGHVALGDHRQPDAGHDEPALEGRNGQARPGPDQLVARSFGGVGDHQAGLGERPQHPVGRAPALGAHDDAVAVGDELAHLLHELLAVGDHRVPAPGLHDGGVGSLGHGRDVPHRRGRARQQAVEVDVQAREHVPVGAPRLGQRVGQRCLLVEQLARPVAHPSGLDQQDLAGRTELVGQHLLVRRQPRQPRLHAVEHLRLGQPLPLLASPRLLTDESAGAFLHRG